jgi:isopentenyldiphosphate isomerase
VSGDELVDVVDADDRVVATVTRREMRRHRLRHRAVFVAVRASDGRLLVHRRSESKDVWPGWWDVAVGGVVASGETYAQAAVRELAEEVGIAPSPRSQLVELGRGSYTDDAVDLVARCYTTTADGPFTFGDGEVVEARWVDATELGRLRGRQRFLPDSLALLLPVLDPPLA